MRSTVDTLANLFNNLCAGYLGAILIANKLLSFDVICIWLIDACLFFTLSVYMHSYELD